MTTTGNIWRQSARRWRSQAPAPALAALAALAACAYDEHGAPQLEDEVGVIDQAAVSGLKRGIHLPNRWYYGSGLTNGDRMVLRQFAPGMVIVMGDNININAVEYLRDELPAGSEIFVRWVPGAGKTSSAPPVGTYSRPETGSRYYAKNYASDGVPAVSASAVVDSILQAYDIYANTYGLRLQRWIPGNEPELEWGNPFEQFDPAKWRDINAYYSDIKLYFNERKGTRNIELYTPGFSQNGAVGVANYWPNGTFTRQFIEGDKVGLDYCVQMIDLYRNFTWHNYWFPGHSWGQRVSQFFPSWLRTRLYSQGYPSRITEAGWIPDEMANRDAFWSGSTSSWSGWYEQDFEYFANYAAEASGVALWLLGSDDPGLEGQHGGTRRDYNTPNGMLSSMRPWFFNYMMRAQGVTGRYRTGQFSRRNLSLNGAILNVSSELADAPARAAVNGVHGDAWNSGGSAPKSITVQLENGGTYAVAEVRAKVAQTPSGNTIHELRLWNGSTWQGPYTKNSYTTNGQWLTWTFSPAVYASRIRLKTTSSPSWVAWSEIEVYGQ
jgi:hypothetical protein